LSDVERWLDEQDIDREESKRLLEDIVGVEDSPEMDAVIARKARKGRG